MSSFHDGYRPDPVTGVSNHWNSEIEICSKNDPQKLTGTVQTKRSDEEKDSLEAGLAHTPQAPPAFDPRQNPDGGLQAWLTVLGGFCILFCSFGWINTIGVFQDYYQTHQLAGYSPSTVSWIPSLEIFVMFFLGPWVGQVLDRYGHREVLAIGTFLHIFGLMMTSLATEYYQFILAQGICSPIGMCMIFNPVMTTVVTWFAKKRSLAFGIVAAGSSLGGVILPIMTQRLIDDVGFGWSMRITAFLMLFLLIVANLTLTARVTMPPKPFDPLACLRPLHETKFNLSVLGAFLFFMGLFIPINYIIVEAQYFGMDYSIAQYLLSILNAASFFGRIIPGYIADKVGNFNVMITTCFCTGILVLALWIPATGNAPIIVFAVFYGLFSGAFFSQAPAIIAQISPDMRLIGVRTGTFFAIISVAALISNPIGGALVVRYNGGYKGLQIFAGVVTLSGAFVIAAARYTLVGFKVMTKV